VEPDEALALLDWKRRVSDVYAHVRAAREPADGWKLWRDAREHLLRTHPQSPVARESRGAYAGRYYEFDVAFRVLGALVTQPPERREIAASTGEPVAFVRFATLEFELAGLDCSLELYWLEGYGGGLFLPFRDGTSGDSTYGAGRYLLDTVKGADLGSDGRRLVLDFNFAYNPSCAYDARWACPLAPEANRLPVDVRAGEQAPWAEKKIV
jgi:uncharacterized protein (DUF1684 family)